jgi:hypothetical protein
MTHDFHERGHETTCNVCGKVIEEDEPRMVPKDIMVKGSKCVECAEKERR